VLLTLHLDLHRRALGFHEAMAWYESRKLSKIVSDEGDIEVRLLDDGEVPLVTFVGSSPRISNLSGYMAWMLQKVFGATAKAQSLYRPVTDQHLEDEVRQLGLQPSTISLIQLQLADQPPYRGIGASGKHSDMLALVLRAGMDGKFDKAFKQELESYSLYGILQELLIKIEALIGPQPGIADFMDCEPPSTNIFSRLLHDHDEVATKIEPVSPVGLPDVKLWVVSKHVPVVDMPNKGCDGLCEWVAQLLQAVMGSDTKAQKLVHYVTDYNSLPTTKQAFEECTTKLGLSAPEIGMVKLEAKDGQEVLAVGISGKRSSMLAAVVAMAFKDNSYLDNIEPQIAKISSHLVQPFYSLIHCAVQLQKTGGITQQRQESKQRHYRMDERLLPAPPSLHVAKSRPARQESKQKHYRMDERCLPAPPSPPVAKSRPPLPSPQMAKSSRKQVAPLGDANNILVAKSRPVLPIPRMAKSNMMKVESLGNVGSSDDSMERRRALRGSVRCESMTKFQHLERLEYHPPSSSKQQAGISLGRLSCGGGHNKPLRSRSPRR